jgi:hypothetical protein
MNRLSNLPTRRISPLFIVPTRPEVRRLPRLDISPAPIRTSYHASVDVNGTIFRSATPPPSRRICQSLTKPSVKASHLAAWRTIQQRVLDRLNFQARRPSSGEAMKTDLGILGKGGGAGAATGKLHARYTNDRTKQICLSQTPQAGQRSKARRACLNSSSGH